MTVAGDHHLLNAVHIIHDLVMLHQFLKEKDYACQGSCQGPSTCCQGPSTCRAVTIAAPLRSSSGVACHAGPLHLLLTAEVLERCLDGRGKLSQEAQVFTNHLNLEWYFFPCLSLPHSEWLAWPQYLQDCSTCKEPNWHQAERAG